MALRQFRLHPRSRSSTCSCSAWAPAPRPSSTPIVDSVVLRPLPYRAPDRAGEALGHEPREGPDARPDLAGDVHGLPGAAGVRRTPPAGGGRTSTWSIPAWTRARQDDRDSANLFAVLGVGPQAGRGLPEDGAVLLDASCIAVISDRLWRTRYNADPGIIGQADQPERHAVHGRRRDAARVPVPGRRRRVAAAAVGLQPAQPQRAFRGGRREAGRGTSLEQARAAARRLATRLAQEFEASNKGWAFGVVPLLDDQLGYYRPALYVLFGAVGLLFVIGCLNVASLLLTRALSARAGNRRAHGAGRRAAPDRHAAAGGELSAVTGRRRGGPAGRAGRAAAGIAATMPVAVPRLAEAAVNGRVLGAGAGLVARHDDGVRPGAGAASWCAERSGADCKSGERGSSRAARGAVSGAGDRGSRAGLRAARGIRAADSYGAAR